LRTTVINIGLSIGYTYFLYFFSINCFYTTKMLIDLHAHCYPEDVWPKVQAAIYKRYGTQADNRGTVHRLKKTDGNH